MAAGSLALTLACSRVDGGTDADEPAAGNGGSGNAGSGKGGSGVAGSVSPVGGSAGSGGSVQNGGSSGSGGASGSGGVAMPPPAPDFLADRGITLPFASYEAEAMMTNGLITDATRNFGAVSAEASGRRAVRLLDTGDYVEFANAYQSNSIVVRYSIPDEGPDHWVTLSVSVNGESRGKLNLTSRYSWSYGGENEFNQPAQKDPNFGNPHHYFDEAHALIGDVPAGAIVRVSKEADDVASYYVDLVELEQVAEPLAMPANFVSLTDCGAVPNDNGDDSVAIQNCVNQAQGEGKGLFIPVGAFQSYSAPIFASNVTIRGAGIWHSSINGFNARFECTGGGGCKFYDFAAFGDTTRRDDAATETFLRGNGSGCVVENMWIEHLNLGVWTDRGTSGLTIKNSRLRNLHADAVNLYNGTVDSTVEGNHIRNTGDDAIASWSHTADSPGPSRNNVYRKNYVQVPWRANCFGIYGGQNNTIEDNVCADVVQYPGVLFARQFDSHDFSGMTSLTRNTIIRAGGAAYDHTHGALKFHADQGPVANITVNDLLIVDPTFSGIHVQGLDSVSGVSLTDVTIENPGNASFFLNGGSKGSMDAVSVVVSGGATAVIDESEGQFNLVKGAGSSGW
ncbi:MAG TPA: right-handed parallel beta-helix repeat-containing protein [Polyangiaceae bacterium]|nr:right-handed parallel beta-helix repeat-containing protein [Polyangiaceae bacterium]